MIGNGSGEKKRKLPWFSLPIRYFVVDGGSGAHLLARLAGYDPRLQEVASPRHAQVLLIVGPITQKFAASVVTLAQAFPFPVHVLLVDAVPHSFETTFMQLETLFPQAERIEDATPEAITDALFHASPTIPPPSLPASSYEPGSVQIPGKDVQEMATELIVLSLGPVQPYTSGPLRLVLACDGEQIFTAHTEAGYARRDLSHVLTQMQWLPGMQVARALDPLAPFAGQLAYIEAIEHLQHWQPSSQMSSLRMVVLSLERVQNVLWWLVRFLHLLEAPHLFRQAYDLANLLDVSVALLWLQPPSDWIVPQQESADVIRKEALLKLSVVLESLTQVQKKLEREPWLVFRLRDIGYFDPVQLEAAGVTGPVLLASQQRKGDAQSRLLLRLHLASADLRANLNFLKTLSSVPFHAAHWEVPAGEAQVRVEGPRGVIGLHLVSIGEKQPQQGSWERPSAALLPLLPAFLANLKLADAEVALASLDLSMMEADG